MAKTSRTRRKPRGGKPNYLIVGKGGKVILVSGATGEVSTLNEAQAKSVLDLIERRQELGRKLTKLLQQEGFSVSPLGAVHLHEDD